MTKLHVAAEVTQLVVPTHMEPPIWALQGDGT